MKKMLVVGVLMIWTQSLFAQTFAEWFKQKKTQIKYLTQQIAALQVYAGYLGKGYHIAQQGLTTIGEIKKGEFGLHQVFFSSLSAINPSIGQYAKVAEIISLQLSIVEKYKSCYQKVQQSSYFNSKEVNYIYIVFTHLLNDCTSDISELIMLTTNGQLQLSDDERLQRIDQLFNDMQDKYAFTQSFSNETNLMALARLQDQSDIHKMSGFYNLQK
jgi:hypothetical protein